MFSATKDKEAIEKEFQQQLKMFKYDYKKKTKHLEKQIDELNKNLTKMKKRSASLKVSGDGSETDSEDASAQKSMQNSDLSRSNAGGDYSSMATTTQ